MPIDPNAVLSFKREDAQPDKIREIKPFLAAKARSSESVSLFTEAFDFKPELDQEEEKTYKEYEGLTEAIPVQFFPPCIKNILKGLKDGKKRALFIISNFLQCCGWGHDDIEKLIREWNEKNPEKLRENIIIGQLRYRKMQKKRIPPPNCINSIYKDMRICVPDNLCSKIKNPVNYSKRKINF